MGRPARIDRAAIIAAAVAIADNRGVGAVTMQAVANRLAVTPMALYRHVGNKADLLDGLVEHLLTEFPLAPSDIPWPDRLADLARSIRRTAHRHPGVFPLLLARPAATPAARQTRDAVYRDLQEAGVPSDQVARVERLVSTAVLGFTVSEVSERFRSRTPADLDGDFDLLLDMLAQFIRNCAAPSTDRG